MSTLLVQLNWIPARSERVAFRMIDREAVLVDPATGMVNVLNPVGAFVWERVDGRTPLAVIAEQVEKMFKVSLADALRDVLEFAADLAEKGLVTWTGRRPAD